MVGCGVGCADVIRGWPASDTALLGVLLLDGAHRGHDVGTSGYQQVEAKCGNGRKSTSCE